MSGFHEPQQWIVLAVALNVYIESLVMEKKNTAFNMFYLLLFYLHSILLKSLLCERGKCLAHLFMSISRFYFDQKPTSTWHLFVVPDNFVFSDETFRTAYLMTSWSHTQNLWFVTLACNCRVRKRSAFHVNKFPENTAAPLQAFTWLLVCSDFCIVYWPRNFVPRI